MSDGSVHGAPRYSDAQIALLERFGLVPWVRRNDRIATPPVDTIPAVAPVVAPVAYAVPDELPARGDGLAARPLAGFARRGEQRHETGPEGSTLLIVAEAAPGTVTLLPLEQRETDLLDLMMRSIDLAPGDWSTAVLADPVRDGTSDGVVPAPHVGSLLAGRRVLLWLVRDIDDDPSCGDHRFLVDGVPAFRVPHPAALLEHPLLKRRAWQVLKSVRNLIAGAASTST